MFLGFLYPEHLGSTGRACSLGCWPPILHVHGYGFSISHFLFGSTLHTVCLHQTDLPFLVSDMPSIQVCQWSRTDFDYGLYAGLRVTQTLEYGSSLINRYRLQLPFLYSGLLMGGSDKL